MKSADVHPLYAQIFPEVIYQPAHSRAGVSLFCLLWFLLSQNKKIFLPCARLIQGGGGIWGLVVDSYQVFSTGSILRHKMS